MVHQKIDLITIKLKNSIFIIKLSFKKVLIKLFNMGRVFFYNYNFVVFFLRRGLISIKSLNNRFRYYSKTIVLFSLMVNISLVYGLYFIYLDLVINVNYFFFSIILYFSFILYLIKLFFLKYIY